MKYLIGIPAAAAAAVMTLFSFYAFAMQCGDSCSSGADESWTERTGSWQWTAQFVLALLGLMTFMVAGYFADRRTWRKVGIWTSVSVVSYAGALAFLLRPL